MTTTNELHRPEPLSDFLDRGGDLRAALGGSFKGYVDDLLFALSEAEEPRERRVWWSRRHVDEVIDDVWQGTPMMKNRTPRESIRTKTTHGKGWDSLQDFVNHLSWACDFMEDVTLAQTIVDLMEPDERRLFAAQLELTRAPYELKIRPAREAFPTRSRWRCGSCGAALEDASLVLSVSGRLAPDGESWWSEVDPETIHCFDCVTIVHEAMKAARGQ